MSWISQAGGAISKGWKDLTSGISAEKIAGAEQRGVSQYQVDDEMQKEINQIVNRLKLFVLNIPGGVDGGRDRFVSRDVS